MQHRLEKYVLWQSLTLAEWVLMVLLAVANGVLTSGLSGVNQMLFSLGGSMLTSSLVGLYMVYGLLAMYLIRKPGAAFMTYALGAFIQILMGTAYGAWSALADSACYTLVVEFLFYWVRYRHFNWGIMLFVGIAVVPLWFMVSAFMFGYLQYESGALIIMTFHICCLSGMLLCGALTKVIGDRLASIRSALSFVLGRQY